MENTKQKVCLKCGKPLENKRKKYCSEKCKWWYNSIKKDKEKHLPPKKYRNRNYFKMVVGSEWAKSTRQGKRSGSMVTGAMAAMIRCTVEEIAEVNKENLERHFKGIQGYTPLSIRNCVDEIIRKEDIYKEYGIQL